jgi:hypothetical protein
MYKYLKMSDFWRHLSSFTAKLHRSRFAAYLTVVAVFSLVLVFSADLADYVVNDVMDDGGVAAERLAELYDSGTRDTPRT